MFQFPGFPCISYVFTYTYPWFSWMGFPIRISADRRIFASPRRFSQLITSFFGFQCQGIHHALFFAWPSRHIALCLMAYSIFRLLWFVFVILLRITGSMSWYFINLFSVCSFQGTFSGVVWFTGKLCLRVSSLKFRRYDLYRFAFSDCLNSHHIVKLFYYLIAVQIFL